MTADHCARLVQSATRKRKGRTCRPGAKSAFFQSVIWFQQIVQSIFADNKGLQMSTFLDESWETIPRTSRGRHDGVDGHCRWR